MIFVKKKKCKTKEKEIKRKQTKFDRKLNWN